MLQLKMLRLISAAYVIFYPITNGNQTIFHPMQTESFFILHEHIRLKWMSYEWRDVIWNFWNLYFPEISPGFF